MISSLLKIIRRLLSQINPHLLWIFSVKSSRHQLKEYGPLRDLTPLKPNRSLHQWYPQVAPLDLKEYFPRHILESPLSQRWVLIRTRWKKQLKNTLKWLNRQGKIFLGKLTTLADLCLKCCTERQKLKNNISGRIKRNIPLPIFKNESMGRNNEYSYKLRRLVKVRGWLFPIEREHEAQQHRAGCMPQAVECRCWAKPNSPLRKEEINLPKKARW